MHGLHLRLHVDHYSQAQFLLKQIAMATDKLNKHVPKKLECLQPLCTSLSNNNAIADSSDSNQA